MKNNDEELVQLRKDMKDFNTSFEELDVRTLQWYEENTPKICPTCNGTLSEIKHYGPHSGGWRVAGYKDKRWLYRNCRKCHNDLAIWKLGVPR